MKIGLSCIITPREWSFDETLSNAKAAGYEALELVITDEGEITLDTPASELERLSSRAKDAGIELTSVCPGFRNRPKDLMTNDEAVRLESIDNVRRALDVVKGLGVDTMLLTLGGLPAELYYNEAYANALRSMTTLAPYAEEVGVNLAIEYVWNRFLLSPMEFARFCDECASPRVGFFFDTGNMVIFGYPEHWARICGKHIQKVHFKDFKRPGTWTPLLEGDVDFPAVMAELRKVGYNDPVLSEVAPSTASLEETADAMRKILEM
ncbi:MAG: sugar phosphate isomerase/epimerase [Armatimonadetes bacterium]|nr:sugar phosphate isomerase/epimerase [Armatimonadota bacterium]